MILNRTSKDITYTSDGDFMLGSTGNISLSTMGDNQLLGEVIYRRLKSSFGEWRSEFAVSADLKDVIGLELNQTNIEFISDSIRRALTEYNLLSSAEIAVSPAGVIGTRVAMSVSVYSEISQSNVLLAIVYDTRDNDFEVKFLEEKAY
jgi:hypothetical protein